MFILDSLRFLPMLMVAPWEGNMLRSTSDGRKAQIIREATRLFSHDGYDKVTVKQLADACSITEPAIYRHYPSKEAIYDAVLDSLKSQLRNEALFAELEQENDIEILLGKLASHVISFFTDHQEIYRLLLYSTLQEHSHGRQIFDVIRGTYVRYLHRQLDRLFEQKLILEKNNEITARCFVGLIFDCALSATLFRGMLGKPYQPSEIIGNNVPIFARGLRTGDS